MAEEIFTISSPKAIEGLVEAWSSLAHVAAHELGAAAYAIKAACAAALEGEREAAGIQECRWQRAQLSHEIRDLVLDDQGRRNGICWSVFDC